jgi:hypothetical protein
MSLLTMLFRGSFGLILFLFGLFVSLARCMIGVSPIWIPKLFESLVFWEHMERRW